MKITKEKFRNIKVTLEEYPPGNHISEIFQSMREKNFEQLEISEIIWLELFSGDLNPEDLLLVLNQIKIFATKVAIEKMVTISFLSLYIKFLESGNYLYWAYSDLIWISHNSPESKKLLEGVI